MPRAKRITVGGYVYHVLNRANGRLRVFCEDADFLAFERILAEGVRRFGMRVCGYCIMGNHWHLLLWPIGDGELSRFMRWITLTHVQRYHASHGTVGMGHLYQGRYKSFAVQDDGHYLTVMRYIEANPLRAGIVENAGAWRWASFAVRLGRECPFELSVGPVELPDEWARLVHDVIDSKQHDAMQNSVKRGVPFGDATWQMAAVKRMGLEATMRSRGRPMGSA